MHNTNDWDSPGPTRVEFLDPIEAESKHEVWDEPEQNGPMQIILFTFLNLKHITMHCNVIVKYIGGITT